MSNLAALKAAVIDKNSKAASDTDAARALLRCYQLESPGAFDWDVVAAALLLARVHQASFANDFALLCCLVPDAQHATSEMKWLFALDDALAMGKFPRVWVLLRELSATNCASLHAAYAAQKGPIEGALRRNIIFAIASAFTQLETSTVLAFANAASVAELATMGKGIIEKADDKLVTFSKTDANHPPPAAAPRTLQTSDVAALTKALMALTN